MVIPAPGFGAEDATHLLENVRARVPAQMHLTVEIAHWLERTPRGKTPLIVHRPPVHDALRRKSRGSVPITASTGLLILAKRAFLKASELNSTRSIERMLYPDRKYSSSNILMASGSWGGVSIQDGKEFDRFDPKSKE